MANKAMAGKFRLGVTKMLSRRTLNSQLSTLKFFGFTLLELLVVLAIMAMLTAMSVPAISGYIKGARLKGGAREIASALRQARTLAITQRARRAVILYHTDNAVSVYENDGLQYRYLPDTIDLYRVDGGSPDTDGTETVTFKPNGTTTDNDTFRVYDTANRYREITVNAAGGVRVSEAQ